MPNIASILKAEITRVARKEVRAELEALKKASSHHRNAIAALRREVEAMHKELRRLQKQGPAKDTPPPKQAQLDESGLRRRFSATRLAAHRHKLELSAASYGKLVGIGGQTIYNWEQGKTRPNALQVQKLAAIKELTRSEVLAQLEASAAG